MGLRIDTSQNFILRQIQQTQSTILNTQARLASGLRINRAADDAAGLAVAEGLRSQVLAGLREVANAQNTVSLAQTAEGGLVQVGDALQRIRELALQAANGTLNDQQREAINAEAQLLIEEIGATAENTQFNNIPLLNGDVTEVPAGIQGSDVGVQLPDVTPDTLGLTGLSLATAEDAAAAIETIDTAIQNVSTARAQIGADVNALGVTINRIEIGTENQAAAESRIREADILLEVINRAREEILSQGAIAVLAQSNVLARNVAALLGP